MNDIPAFPTTLFEHGGESNGMTLRDYFAAKAMQPFLDQLGCRADQRWFDEVAEGSYKMADAMMKAREA
jgi:hypothetical protein